MHNYSFLLNATGLQSKISDLKLQNYKQKLKTSEKITSQIFQWLLRKFTVLKVLKECF